MGDEAHVRLVDAHAERDRRDDDQAVFLEEPLLRATAVISGHAGVIGDGGAPLVGQPLRGFLDALARQAVDDAGIARMLAVEKLPQPIAGAHRAHLGDRVADVRPVEAGDELAGGFEPELARDLGARALVGRCCQRDAGYARKAVGEQAKLPVLGPEIVAPLRHAMRLVDRKQRNARPLQQRNHAILDKSLGRDIEQVERALGQCLLDLALGLPVKRRIQEGGADAKLAQRVDLVLHQCDQR